MLATADSIVLKVTTTQGITLYLYLIDETFKQQLKPQVFYCKSFHARNKYIKKLELLSLCHKKGKTLITCCLSYQQLNLHLATFIR